MSAVDVLAVLARHVSLAEKVACLEQQAEAHAVFDAVAEQQQWVAHLEAFIGPSALPTLRQSFAEGCPAGGAQ